MSKSRKKIGLALGGGFVRAAAHIGAIKVLTQNRVPIDYVSGLSSGGIVAAAYATGNLWKLERLLYRLNPIDYIKLFHFWVSKHSLLSGEKGLAFFKYITNNQSFDDIDKEGLFIASADLIKAEICPIHKGNIAEAIQASIALPGILNPVYKGKRVLVDGGILTDMYAEGLYKRGADVVIAVNVSLDKKLVNKALGKMKRHYQNLLRLENKQKKRNYTRDINFLGNMSRSFNINLTNIAANKYRNEKVDVTVRPDVGKVGRYGVNYISECIKQGEREMKKKLPEVLKSISDPS